MKSAQNALFQCVLRTFLSIVYFWKMLSNDGEKDRPASEESKICKKSGTSKTFSVLDVPLLYGFNDYSLLSNSKAFCMDDVHHLLGQSPAGFFAFGLYHDADQRLRAGFADQNTAGVT